MTYEFLYLPECPIPLLGRDLLKKLRAQITFTQGRFTSLTVRGPNAFILALTMPTEDEWQPYCLAEPIFLLEEFPDVWTEKGPLGLAYNHAPIMIDLKLGFLPVRQRQYPVPQEAHLGIQTHLQ
jgi:hypothetical protein